LLLTRKFDAWFQLTVLVGFAALAVTCALIAVRLRTPAILRLLTRGMRSSSQLPVCLSLLIVSSFGVIAGKIGFEPSSGLFPPEWSLASLPPAKAKSWSCFARRWRRSALRFSFLFFVMSGMKLEVHALFHSAWSFILVPVFLAMFVVVRGTPVQLYRSELRREERLPFALYSATGLPMVVAISEIGLRLNFRRTEIVTALIGAGLLSALPFPDGGRDAPAAGPV